MEQRSPPSGTGISSLPDELVMRILDLIHFQERHRSTSLVSRRWRRLVLSPQLLRLVYAYVCESPRALQRTRSLSTFLLRHAAPHVHQLEVDLEAHSRNPAEMTLVQAAMGGTPAEAVHRGDASEQLVDLLGAVAVCGATSSGPLTYLSLTFIGLGAVRLPSWVGPALGRLRRLSLIVVEVHEERSLIAVLVPLSPLSQLAQLELHADALHLAPDALLPPSLTKLQVSGLQGPSLPEQLTSLTQLRHLHFWRPQLRSQESYARLTSLASCLQWLEFHSAPCLPSPDILASLTSLQTLHLRRPSSLASYATHGVSGASAELDATLRALPHLSALLICADGFPGAVRLGSLPDALSTLTSLESLCWQGNAPEEGSLPAGPWMSNMRKLAIPAEVLASSMESLSAAVQLESLLVLDVLPRPAHLGALCWAALRLPSLRHLQMASQVHFQSESGRNFLETLHLAAQLNPRLSFRNQVFDSLTLAMMSF